MSDIWFISDTHFGHANILGFKNYDGTPLRVFEHVDAMDEHTIKQWNSVVKPQDKVYHLGDCVINKKHLPTLLRLNGHKRLVRGNHDIEDTSIFIKYFEDVYGVRVFSKEGFICSHIPIHPDCLSKWKVNVHGHLHGNRILLPNKQINSSYYSVCVEQINYTPVHIDTIIKYIKDLK
jgi:calcineurin-like phosphoesterase family protein